MKVKSESEVAQSCLTLHDPMDCSLPDSSVHGIFQARALEWVAIAFSEIVAEDLPNLGRDLDIQVHEVSKSPKISTQNVLFQDTL